MSQAEILFMAGGNQKTQIVGSSTITHTKATIGATTTAVIAANSNRKYLLLINDSDAAVYLKCGADAVMSEGIRINASGGSYEMSATIGNLYLGVINAISAAGSKLVLVSEGV